MIYYEIGGRYSSKDYELALSPAEWERLLNSKRKRISIYGEDGTKFTIRVQRGEELRAENVMPEHVKSGQALTWLELALKGER